MIWRQLGRFVGLPSPPIVASHRTLGNGYVNLVSLENFLRLVSFFYFLSLKEPPSKVQNFDWEEK